MKKESPPLFALPTTEVGRVVAFLVTLFPFAVFSLCLVAFPTVWVPTPPPGILGVLMYATMLALILFATLFCAMVLVWAVATPRWVGALLMPSAHRLAKMTGHFLIATGVGFLCAGVVTATMFPYIMMVANIAIGLRILWVVKFKHAPPAR